MQRGEVIKLYQSLDQRASYIQQACNLDGLPAIYDAQSLFKEAKAYTSELLNKAQSYKLDADIPDREKRESQLLELKSRKWLSEQIVAIKKEVERLRELQILEKAKKLTNSVALSRKKGELAQELITDAYIDRFNNELELLQADNLRVELKKTRVAKGQVLHEIVLQTSNSHDPKEVLSEGERRIVTLAAFLADVTGKENPAPFIFDDPITSLDEDFEELVVNRLIELSRNRQVIVFTHRISLVAKLKDTAKKDDNTSSNLLSIKKRGESTGEPTKSPIYVRKTKSVLKELNQRLNIAKKSYREEIELSYEIIAKSMCSDFRILLERIVEEILLADVVHRFRRDIHTKNKIENLSKIQSSDCEFIDSLMTKYSMYEHSQPRSSSVPLPEPKELEKDLKNLNQWFNEYQNR
jgi:energy-coupling factor transporter ATP-binding protein EcfA2